MAASDAGVVLMIDGVPPCRLDDAQQLCWGRISKCCESRYGMLHCCARVGSTYEYDGKVINTES